jgi:hypothetical protein
VNGDDRAGAGVPAARRLSADVEIRGDLRPGPACESSSFDEDSLQPIERHPGRLELAQCPTSPVEVGGCVSVRGARLPEDRPKQIVVDADA